METILAIVVGLFFAAAIYLMLSPHLVRIIIGVSLFGNAVNLLIFTAGRLTEAVPPLLFGPGATDAEAANPLPQALILTAIVISFSFFAFLLVLTLRAYQSLETDDVREMRRAEAPAPRPEVEY